MLISYLTCLFLFSYAGPLLAAGINDSVANINQLMAAALEAVDSGDPDLAEVRLEFAARNLEKSSAWSAFIWAERQNNPSYTPITLNALPESLTVAYYTAKMDAYRDDYENMISNIENAQIEQKNSSIKQCSNFCLLPLNWQLTFREQLQTTLSSCPVISVT